MAHIFTREIECVYFVVVVGGLYFFFGISQVCVCALLCRHSFLWVFLFQSTPYSNYQILTCFSSLNVHKKERKNFIVSHLKVHRETSA